MLTTVEGVYRDGRIELKSYQQIGDSIYHQK
jgi:hypothetical protein